MGDLTLRRGTTNILTALISWGITGRGASTLVGGNLLLVCQCGFKFAQPTQHSFVSHSLSFSFLLSFHHLLG